MGGGSGLLRQCVRQTREVQSALCWGDRHAGEKLQKGQDNEVILFLTFFNRSVWLEIGEVFQTLLNRAREREAKKFW